jgi:hypothetical protein
MWLAGSLLHFAMGWVGKDTVQSILWQPSPQVLKLSTNLEPRALGLLLHHGAAEAYRRVTRHWEAAQILLGLGLLATLFFAPGGKRYTLILCTLMLGSVLFLRWFISAEIRALSPGADFVLDTEESLARDRLRSLETGYLIIDASKFALGLVLAFGLIKRSRRRKETVDLNG